MFRINRRCTYNKNNYYLLYIKLIKINNLIIIGRLILLKSVMSSLPVYFLSFFKAPTCIISSIESLFNFFFWGGGEVVRKIAWVDWDTICLSKEAGGLMSGG